MKQKWDAELYEAKHNFVWELGQGVVDLLAPKRAEQILDVGCGTGHLTKRIAESGAFVTGIDSSPEMIGQARQNFPDLKFILGSATAMNFDAEFDAVFSNATLHWVLEAQTAANHIFKALKPGGRFVAEFGGRGNVQTIETTIRTLIAEAGLQPVPRRTYYPSVHEYAGVLESAGFEVRFAQLFDRPTPLDGNNGIDNWIRQFKYYYFEPLDRDLQQTLLARAKEVLRHSLYKDGRWFADYRRLRIVAIRSAGL